MTGNESLFADNKHPNFTDTSMSDISKNLLNPSNMSNSTQIMGSDSFVTTTTKVELAGRTAGLGTEAEKEALSPEQEMKMKKMSKGFRTISDGK